MIYFELNLILHKTAVRSYLSTCINKKIIITLKYKHQILFSDD